MLLASLAAAVASFLLGWLIYGMLLADVMAGGTNQACMRAMEDMNMMAMVIANLIWGLLFGWTLWKMGVNTAMGGVMPGAILAALIAAGMDMFLLAMSLWFTNSTVIIVDVVASAVQGAIVGAVVGWMLGMGKKAA